MKSIIQTKFLILLGLMFTISSCGQKKIEEVILNRSGGFKAVYYSESTKNNWIPISGSMIFKTNADENSGNGIFDFSYSDYKDQFGNCTATIIGTVEIVDFTQIMPNYTEDNSVSYDVNRPYRPNSSVAVPLEAQLFGVNFTTTSYKDGGTYCPFSLFTTNRYALILYPTGRLIITDINRGLDFLMFPN